MRRIAIVVPALIVGIFALVLVGGATAKKPALSATPVFKLNLKPSQEVPPIKGLKADARGSVTFDLELVRERGDHVGRGGDRLQRIRSRTP